MVNQHLSTGILTRITYYSCQNTFQMSKSSKIASTSLNVSFVLCRFYDTTFPSLLATRLKRTVANKRIAVRETCVSRYHAGPIQGSLQYPPYITALSYSGDKRGIIFGSSLCRGTPVSFSFYFFFSNAICDIEGRPSFLFLTSYWLHSKCSQLTWKTNKLGYSKPLINLLDTYAFLYIHIYLLVINLIQYWYCSITLISNIGFIFQRKISKRKQS